MGSKDPKPEPSLELPKLGFGRKRRTSGKTAEDAAAIGAEPTAGEEQETAAAPEPVPAPPLEPSPGPTSATAPEATRRAPATTRDPVDQGPVDQGPVDQGPVVEEPVVEAEAPRERRSFRLPAVPGLVAAVLTGLLIGLLAVFLTGLSLRLCEVVKGTSSCGGPGLFLLVAILIGLTYLGGWLLRAFSIADPLSTSFLAVGLLAVVAMLFLIDLLFAWWMVIVIPLVAAATYALSWWVTTELVDEE